MKKIKVYKNEIYIFVLLSFSAFSWQVLNLIVKIYALDYLSEVIYIQGVIIFGSFFVSLGMGTYIRFLVYDNLIKDIRVLFNIIFLITLGLFLVSFFNLLSLYFFDYGYQSISVLFLIGLLSLFSFYISFSLARRNIYLLSIYTFLYIVYTSVLLLTGVFIKTQFVTVYSLSFIYSLLSLSGIIILIVNSKHIEQVYIPKKIFNLLQKSFFYFYLVIPIRLLIFILSFLIAKASRLDTSIAEIFVYSQIGTSVIKFFISRIFLILEKKFFKMKKLPILVLLSIFLFCNFLVYFTIATYINRYDITIFLIVSLLLNTVLYGYIKQFDSRSYTSTTYFLIFLIFSFFLIYIVSKVWLIQNLVIILCGLNLSVLFFMLKRKQYVKAMD